MGTTKGKSRREKVSENERQLTQLANAMPQLVWMANAEGDVTYFNDRVAEMGDVIQQPDGIWNWGGMLHPDDYDDTMKEWNHARSNGLPYEKEQRLLMSDGNFRWHLNRAIPQRNDRGEVIKWFGTATDVHEQKTFAQRLESLVAERTEQLVHEKDFIETILNSSNDIIAVFDTNFKYLSGNTRLEQQYGVKKDDYIGKHLFDVFPGVRGSSFYNDLQKCLEGKTISQPAYRSKLTGRWYQNSMVPLTEVDGSVYGALVVGHDITEVMEVTETIKEFNEALTEKNLELERTNKDLESFSYVASHDLQEPLRKIQTFIELVQSNENDPETKGIYYNKIKTSAKRMSQLIRSVLSYSKISTAHENFEPVDLNEVLDNVRSDFELLILEKKAIINSDRLPVINGVAIQMHQLFSNLISNSLKFVTSDPVITISVQAINDDELTAHQLNLGQQWIQLCFNDNGIGFEQQYSDKVFNLFQRLHGKNEYSGTGIGLSIVKKIVDKHGGQIKAISSPGEGTSFLIWLPLIHRSVV